MIGFLHGVLRDKQPPVIEVQGVGYEVQAPMTTFYDLPAVGDAVRLYTHLAVREDAHTLYGFSKLSDRTLFRTLIKVNGVGANGADYFIRDGGKSVRGLRTGGRYRVPG